MRRQPARLLALCAALVAAGAAAVADQSSTFDPSGAWEGPCRTGERTYGTLHVAFRREGRVWHAKGGLRARGYPESDSEFEEVVVRDQHVSFAALWGPQIGQFKGEHEAARLNGTLEVIHDEKVVFRCAWSLARQDNK